MGHAGSTQTKPRAVPSQTKPGVATVTTTAASTTAAGPVSYSGAGAGEPG